MYVQRATNTKAAVTQGNGDGRHSSDPYQSPTSDVWELHQDFEPEALLGKLSFWFNEIYGLPWPRSIRE